MGDLMKWASSWKEPSFSWSKQLAEYKYYIHKAVKIDHNKQNKGIPIIWNLLLPQKKIYN